MGRQPPRPAHASAREDQVPVITGILVCLALAAAPQDDAKLVESLRRRIVEQSKEKSPAAMKPYRDVLPGTDLVVDMAPIPGGAFTMGSPENEAGRKPDEGPQHKVTLEPFWMSRYEVTWDLYRLFQFSKAEGKDPDADAVSHPTRPYVEMSFGMGINGYPAISMTHHAANKFAQWLSARTGHFYRLPTEAEWEYACRAGGAQQSLEESAWFSANSNGKYQKAGARKPNSWGLYDMLGNVMEWTLDQYEPYPAGPVKSPWVKSAQPYPHAVRGGAWNDGPDKLRCSARVASDASWKMQDPQLPKSIWYHTDALWLGFRLVRPLHVPSVVEMNSYWNNGVEVDP
ncbi:MAG: formylglycine-generating enzyme family protein [Candidatus Solibacter usitatus]|nr:formylglycine-generating enzyme family protein [Candidatus Solibacter usitatus]